MAPIVGVFALTMLVVLLVLKLGIAVQGRVPAIEVDAPAPRDWPRTQGITICGTLSKTRTSWD